MRCPGATRVRCPGAKRVRCNDPCDPHDPCDPSKKAEPTWPGDGLSGRPLDGAAGGHVRLEISGKHQRHVLRHGPGGSAFDADTLASAAHLAGQRSGRPDFRLAGGYRQPAPVLSALSEPDFNLPGCEHDTPKTAAGTALSPYVVDGQRPLRRQPFGAGLGWKCATGANRRPGQWCGPRDEPWGGPRDRQWSGACLSGAAGASPAGDRATPLSRPRVARPLAPDQTPAMTGLQFSPRV